MLRKPIRSIGILFIHCLQQFASVLLSLNAFPFQIAAISMGLAGCLGLILEVECFDLGFRLPNFAFPGDFISRCLTSSLTFFVAWTKILFLLIFVWSGYLYL